MDQALAKQRLAEDYSDLDSDNIRKEESVLKQSRHQRNKRHLSISDDESPTENQDFNILPHARTMEVPMEFDNIDDIGLPNNSEALLSVNNLDNNSNLNGQFEGMIEVDVPILTQEKSKLHFLSTSSRETNCNCNAGNSLYI